MIVKEQYRGFLNGALNVYKTGGILAFYEGLSASLLQVCVTTLGQTHQHQLTNSGRQADDGLKTYLN